MAPSRLLQWYVFVKQLNISTVFVCKFLDMSQHTSATSIPRHASTTSIPRHASTSTMTHGNQQSDQLVSKVILAKVREALKRYRVQLWDIPYLTAEGTPCEEQLQQLCVDFKDKLGLYESEIMVALKHLQKHSISKKSLNNLFRTQGIATLYLKVGDKTTPQTESTLLQTPLDITGEDLAHLVKATFGQVNTLVTLICQGKKIKPDATLVEQNVKHNSVVFCISVSNNDKDKYLEMEKIMKSIAQTKRGAELLADNGGSSSNNYSLQILDQNGRSLSIPKEENDALIIALSLHKQGQILLKKSEFKNALLYLLEADDEFQKCSGTLLQSVDNYPILNLDISWCYLSLKSLDALFDVNARLTMSEQFFNKVYGENLQRLFALKGSTGEEVALFVRLYTLQGVAAYHDDKFELASTLFQKAKGYISTLDVDDDKLTKLLELGFDSVESQQALRACNGDLTNSIQFAYTKREQRQQITSEEKEKERKQKLSHNLGKCKNGEKVDVDAFENMVNNLEYDRGMVKEALKIFNNDVAKAIEAIQNNDPDVTERALQRHVEKTYFNRLSEMGYSITAARAALNFFRHFCGSHTTQANGATSACVCTSSGGCLLCP